MKINFANKANEKYVLRNKKDPSLFLCSHIIKYHYDYDDTQHDGRYKSQYAKSLNKFLERQEERRKEDNYIILDIPYEKYDHFSNVKGKYFYHLFTLTNKPENALCYNADNISIDLMNLIKKYVYDHDELSQFKQFKSAFVNDKYTQHSLLAFQSTDFFKFIDENFHFVKPVVTISYDGEPEYDASAILMANCFSLTNEKEKQYK
jgi:hypothetical protein